ncbi:hypothetical protein BLOT_013884 [Blomia tropicalis]|nr:hypothetical protein BLOT_013884 [Blomia tropicalis]
MIQIFFLSRSRNDVESHLEQSNQKLIVHLNATKLVSIPNYYQVQFLSVNNNNTLTPKLDFQGYLLFINYEKKNDK